MSDCHDMFGYEKWKENQLLLKYEVDKTKIISPSHLYQSQGNLGINLTNVTSFTYSGIRLTWNERLKIEAVSCINHAENKFNTKYILSTSTTISDHFKKQLIKIFVYYCKEVRAGHSGEQKRK